MADNVQSSRFAAILLAVRQRLLDRLGLPPGRVLVYGRGGKKVAFPGEAYVALRAVGWAPRSGGGTAYFDVRHARVLAVDVLTRSAVDPAAEDLLALTRADAGHFDREEAVVDALAEWVPVGADGKALTLEPLHLSGECEDPDRLSAEGFIRSTVYFDLQYKSPATARPR